MASSKLDLAYNLFTGIGALLGYVATGWTLVKEYKKGPKIIVQVKSAAIRVSSTYVTSVINGIKQDEYSAVFSVFLQIQNRGTDATSLLEASLKREAKQVRATLEKSAKIRDGDGNERSSNFMFRSNDDRLIHLDPGASFAGPFEFQVSSETDFTESEFASVQLDFVNHAKIRLNVTFERP